ncbi:MAG TPA: phasin family protein [Stellaceae bacterium]|nr:phasin family protein [Stellaceae bacterium]
MAKRPSLVGSGRASLANAAGEDPAPVEAEASAIPPRAARSPRREKPAVENAPAAIVRAEAEATREPRSDGRAAILAELLDFSGERLRRAVAFAETLGRCRNPVEAVAAQSAFAGETLAHYTVESLKLMRLTSTAWTEYWRRLPLYRYRVVPRG